MGVDAGEMLYVQLLCPLQAFPEGGADVTIPLYCGFPPARSWEDWGWGVGSPGARGWGGSFPLSLSFLHHSVIESVLSDSFLPSLC